MEKIKLLIIDDEEDLVTILAERLQFRGFEAVAATDYSGAMNAVNENSFNAAVIDVKLKGVDGIDLMQQIMKIQKDIKVILITGHGTEEEARKGIRLGASKYLVKPININDLISEIREALD